MILTGKVKDIRGLLPPDKQQQIKAALEVLEIELDALIQAKIGEGCQNEELQFIKALLLSKICFSQP
jgi:ATP-dependent DNA helicase RecQ